MNPEAFRTTHQSLSIDLSDVRFIDSSGLGLMIRARKLARQQGINLAFTAPQPPVQNVLRLACLESLLSK